MPRIADGTGSIHVTIRLLRVSEVIARRMLRSCGSVGSEPKMFAAIPVLAMAPGAYGTYSSTARSILPSPLLTS